MKVTLYDLSREINKLKQEERYSAALDYFKENKKHFQSTEITSNKYLVAHMLTCLRKAENGKYVDAGFKFLATYSIAVDGNTDLYVLNAYGWLLWDKYKQENPSKKDDTLQKIEELLPLLRINSGDDKNFLPINLFRIVLKTEKTNWKLINDFCNHFEPIKLSKECSTVQVERKGKLRDMELASDFENWYASKTKALFKLGEWQECFDISKEALEKVDKFHNSNDVWFCRRIALSVKNLGNSNEAIAELKSILNKKKEWFIQKELAEIHFELGDIKQAYKYAIDSINNYGDLEYKINLLYLMGRIFKAQDNPEMALKHFLLAKKIREDEGWKIPKELIGELQQFEDKDIEKGNLEGLEGELKKHWKNLAPVQKEVNKSAWQQGIIKRFLHDNENGKVGFLRCDNNDYYFSLPSTHNLTSKIKIDSKVLFELCSSNKDNKERAIIKKLIG